MVSGSDSSPLGQGPALRTHSAVEHGQVQDERATARAKLSNRRSIHFHPHPQTTIYIHPHTNTHPHMHRHKHIHPHEQNTYIMCHYGTHTLDTGRCYRVRALSLYDLHAENETLMEISLCNESVPLEKIP